MHPAARRPGPDGDPHSRRRHVVVDEDLDDLPATAEGERSTVSLLATNAELVAAVDLGEAAVDGTSNGCRCGGEGHALIARFARRFVLLVPVGMAIVGLSIAGGRNAYRSAEGQLAALAAIAMVVACWMWAGRIMRLPEEERVFDG